MHKYEDLETWHRSIALATAVYDATREFPNAEQFGLTSQLRRAAVSISSNIAEGAGRRSAADFGRFISMAIGSCNEVVTLVEVSRRVGLLDDATAQALADRTIIVRRLSYSLANAHGASV